MKIYVAGPMRSIPFFNYPAFHEAAAKLRALGHHVFNPAERDIKVHGVDVSVGNHEGCEKKAADEHGFDLRAALADDLDFIGRHADAIALLPGWERSKGATAERVVAIALGLIVEPIAVFIGTDAAAGRRSVQGDMVPLHVRPSRAPVS